MPGKLFCLSNVHIHENAQLTHILGKETECLREREKERDGARRRENEKERERYSSDIIVLWNIVSIVYAWNSKKKQTRNKGKKYNVSFRADQFCDAIQRLCENIYHRFVGLHLIIAIDYIYLLWSRIFS